ncbi:hypothetical protein CXG81DRAFT_25852 [Caulochytrium protostelioides]|uniref:Peptidase M20 dimerisation domain-containing protein n=1 Tax=Caulochytrium protostelioides TaxID=1555241 RepID=A0A4P9X883_9FUNG|nr:hypothetical protein CXG81DRAFT_25852 [Caulochytrium protostelioides]|eukprot:RKP01468.1 hypothetical protein CXG81DRAFT_25852 [Caulochytrium protostelioides]
MEAVKNAVHENATLWIARLAEAVAIPSVSGERERRPEVVRMGRWLVAHMQRLGFTDVVERDIGEQTVADGAAPLPLPPVVLGTYGTDPAKKTVLVYGHYDVQPAAKEDGWATDPFQLVEQADGRLVGRGASDDKGPLMGWLWAIEAHQKAGVALPVNLKCCFEGMEESGSEGLDALIAAEAQAGGYFDGVDAVCISDNYWLGTTKPCLTYGLRGVSYFNLTVRGPARDLHSGVFGGTVHEPMTDLVRLMSTLVDPQGKILVPGIYDTVAPVTDAERELYKTIEFSVGDINNATGSESALTSDKAQLLMGRWRNPSLSLHGIEGAFATPGSKTVIPAKVIGKFSIRTVPHQDPDEITRLVKAHVAAEFAKLESTNTIAVACDHAGKSWVADINHWNFTAAIKAVKTVFGVTPDLTREGGSIPVTLTFQEALNKNVLLLPMGRGDDGAHSTNEKLDRDNYLRGIELMATYLHEIAAASTA